MRKVKQLIAFLGSQINRAKARYFRPRIYRNKGYQGARPHARAIARVVQHPERYNNVFRSGEKIMQVHLHTSYPKKMIQLIEMLEKQIPAWRAEGFIGAYGDTPNTAILRLLQRRGFKVIELPESDYRQRVQERYRKSIVERNYPAKYANAPLKRAMIRFD